MLDTYKASYSERSATRARGHPGAATETRHLAQIGQLAASLAHEIKNPLAGISGAIQVISRLNGSEQPHRPILDEVLRQVIVWTER